MGIFTVKPNIKKMKANNDIEGLINALKYKNKKSEVEISIRTNARDALIEIGNRETINALIQVLDYYDYDTRRNAVIALDKIGDASAVEAFIRASNDEDCTVRSVAVTALGKMGDLRAVESLIHRLNDNVPSIRKEAIVALGKLKDKRAVEPLIKLLDSVNDIEIQKAIIYALGEIRDIRAVTCLVGHLNEPMLHNDIESTLKNFMSDSLYKSEFYEVWVNYIVSTPTCNAEKIDILSKFLDKPLSQGVTMMYEGYKSLDYSKVIDGLKLCRYDPLYESYTIKNWIDNLALEYKEDIMKHNIPSSETKIGGIMLTITVPQNQKEMKLLSCPSCGANIDKIVFRGQTVKCNKCESVFQIT